MTGPQATRTRPSAGWSGSYRALSHYFTLRCACPTLDVYVRRILAPFAVDPDPHEYPSPPTPGVPPAYELLEAPTSPSFVLRCNGTRMLASDDPADVLTHLLWHVNAETIRRTGDFLLVHAGAVRTPAGHGMLLAGPSGAGKSTLVARLVQAGFGYLSDEAAALDPVTGRVHPYARAIAFKHDPRRVLGAVPAEEPPVDGGPWHVLADRLRPGAVTGPCEVRFILALQGPPASRTRMEPTSRAEGLAELARNALNLHRYGARALPLLADVADGTTCVALTCGNPDETVAAVTGLAANGTPNR